jgi:hypothetical protein
MYVLTKKERKRVCCKPLNLLHQANRPPTRCPEIAVLMGKAGTVAHQPLAAHPYVLLAIVPRLSRGLTGLKSEDNTVGSVAQTAYYDCGAS